MLGKGKEPSELLNGIINGGTKFGGLEILMAYFINMDEEGSERMDEHLCVLCLRALMNNSYGFTSVMAHPQTIDQICLCLANVNPFTTDERADLLKRKYRTHILVLELLAAVCLVPRGHSRVLASFDNFKRMAGESVRFQTLMHVLRSERSNVGVMSAAMAFINVVVHCVADMNFQVALQHEFTMLGIMPLIDELAKLGIPQLDEQITAYQENFLNVAELVRSLTIFSPIFFFFFSPPPPPPFFFFEISFNLAFACLGSLYQGPGGGFARSRFGPH